MRTTTKTVIKLFSRANGKTGRFFVMKGAQTHKVCATFFELNALTHNVDYINAGKQILNKGLWDQLAILKQGHQTNARPTNRNTQKLTRRERSLDQCRNHGHVSTARQFWLK